MTEPAKKPASTHLSDAFASIKSAGRALVAEATDAALVAGKELKIAGQELADNAAKEYGMQCYQAAKRDGYSEEDALVVKRFVTAHYLHFKIPGGFIIANDAAGPSTPQA